MTTATTYRNLFASVLWAVTAASGVGCSDSTSPCTAETQVVDIDPASQAFTDQLRSLRIYMEAGYDCDFVRVGLNQEISRWTCTRCD